MTVDLYYQANKERLDTLRKARYHNDPDGKAKGAAQMREWRASQEKSKLREAGSKQMTRWLSVPENRIRNCITQAKRRAAAANVPFAITLQDFLPLPTVCPVLGIVLNYVGRDGVGFNANFSPSLDRVIPELGYVPGNVRIISFKANRIKGAWNADDMRKVLAYMEREEKLRLDMPESLRRKIAR